jgi:hypothetical protein
MALGCIMAALALSPSWAQGDASGQSARPPALEVAPNARRIMPEPSSQGGTRADICAELVAFLEQKTAAASRDPPSGAVAPGAAAPARNGQPSGQGPPGQPAPAGGTTSSPASGPPKVDVVQHDSGLVGPVPSAKPSEKQPPISLEDARALAAAKDLARCQDAARRMRRAGVPMPDGLIALAALRPDLLSVGTNDRQ